MFLDRVQASRAWLAGCLATMALLVPGPAGAQPAPAGGASAPTAELTPNERAQRDADKVFKWILIHSDRPRKAGTGRIEEKPAAAARAKPAARTEMAAPNRAAPAAAEPPARPAATPSNAAAPIAAAPIADAAPTPVSTASVLPTPIEPGAAPTRSPQPGSAAAETVDETLAPLFRADPQFPPNLLRTLRKGHVQVRFTVLPDGSVAEPGVVASSNPKLNPSALAAIAQWRFAPLRRPQPGVVDLAFNLD